jgi:hypothetical protein
MLFEMKNLANSLTLFAMKNNALKKLIFFLSITVVSIKLRQQIKCDGRDYAN